jgi:hypothetical protein
MNLRAATRLGFAGSDQGAAVLLEGDARILSKPIRIRMEGAQEGSDFFADILISGRPLVSWFAHFGLHFQRTCSAQPPAFPPDAARRNRNNWGSKLVSFGEI